MKYKMFMLLWMAMLALLFFIVGLLALIGYPDAGIGFWAQKAIQSQGGKITWIAISFIFLVVFVRMSVIEYRKIRRGL